jgi:hypothetical protein
VIEKALRRGVLSFEMLITPRTVANVIKAIKRDFFVLVDLVIRPVSSSSIDPSPFSKANHEFEDESMVVR